MNEEAKTWIECLNLQPHPEGGWYRETYRASRRIPAGTFGVDFEGARAASTAIYYLLTPGTMSAFHRVASDELFHFHAGDPLVQHRIHPDGTHERIELGLEIDAGQSPQAVVPAGVWQGAYVRDGGAYTLVGCTVAPGFDFADFEMGRREELLRRFPQHAAVIQRLTGDPSSAS